MSLISDTTQAVRNAPQAIQGFLALTTPNRLRRELRETMDLYERAVKLSSEMREHPEVGETAAALARLMKKEADDLRAAVGGPLRLFQPDWRATGIAAFAFLLLVLCEVLLLGAAGVRASVVGWGLIAILGATAIVLAIVLLFVLVQAARGPRRTIITGIRAEDLPGLLETGGSVVEPAAEQKESSEGPL
jgi:hypothetical protein